MQRRTPKGPIVALAALLVLSAPAIGGTVVDMGDERVIEIESPAPGAQFGYSLAAGDLDGDGLSELVIGVPGFATGGVPHTGAAYVFDGRSLAAGAVGIADASVLEGAIPRGRLGASLLVADTDGDGRNELLVGAPDADGDAGPACWAFYVLPGAAAMRGGAVDSLAASVAGIDPGARLGAAVFVSSLDEDGGPCLFISAPRAGRGERFGAGSIYMIEPDALVPGSTTPVDRASRLTVSGERGNDALSAVDAADVDGDGAHELVLGAARADDEGTLIDAGAVYIVPVDSLPSEGEVVLPHGATTVVRGTRTSAMLGAAVSTGDVDGDGYDDIAFSAHGTGREGKKETAWGAAYLVLGDAAGLPDSVDLTSEHVFTYSGSSRWSVFGLPLVLEDVNRDGNDDVLVAAQFADCAGDEGHACGSVYLLRGSLRSVVRAKAGSSDLADVIFAGAAPLDRIGGAIEVADVIAGDELDVIIGAPDAARGPDSDNTGSVFIVPGEVVSAAR